MSTGFLGLGSNIGNRRGNLEAAVGALPGHGVKVIASSSVYETEPVGLVRDQREFFNACVKIVTEHDPEGLLDACKAVEAELGRPAHHARHGPRPIDVDVLLIAGMSYSSERLTIPHPEITSRRFVLIPLLELDQELKLPGGEPLERAAAALGPGQDVRRIGSPLI